jgi:hypothetical protein
MEPIIHTGSIMLKSVVGYDRTHFILGLKVCSELSQNLPEDFSSSYNSQIDYLPSFENAKILGQVVITDFFKWCSSLNLVSPGRSFPAGSQKLRSKIVLPSEEDILLFELEDTENSVL